MVVFQQRGGEFIIEEGVGNLLISLAVELLNIGETTTEYDGIGIENVNHCGHGAAVAVIGGGRNVAWMAAHWLRQKRIAYWGALDSWGFLFLSQARHHQPHVKSLIMDREALLSHRQRMVAEPDSYPGLPEHLTEAEQRVFQEVREGVHGNTRLEQERLSADHILGRLLRWPE